MYTYIFQFGTGQFNLKWRTYSNIMADSPEEAIRMARNLWVGRTHLPNPTGYSQYFPVGARLLNNNYEEIWSEEYDG